MYRNAERYGENLKTFYVGNTNIMKEDEKKKILKKYDPDVLPIEVAREIYEETEGLDPLSTDVRCRYSDLAGGRYLSER